MPELARRWCTDPYHRYHRHNRHGDVAGGGGGGAELPGRWCTDPYHRHNRHGDGEGRMTRKVVYRSLSSSQSSW